MTEAKERGSGLEKVNILGVSVTIADEERVLKTIRERIDKKSFDKPFLIVTVNQEFVIQAQEDGEFRRILNGADLAIADGAGLKLAVPGLPIAPGRRIVQRLVTVRDYRIFYLGGRGGAAEEMARKYGGRGDEGEKSIKTGEQESGRILDRINKYRPDILFVAYGAPWQEKWIWANRSRIKAKVVMGVGGAFDYLTGLAKVPPGWVSTIGLEWLWRLMHEPWRWRRQLRLVKFVWLVLRG